jgi:hypothetical protein
MRSSTSSSILGSVLSLLLVAGSQAQSLELDKRGGDIGGSVSFDLRGPANDQYLVLLSLIEATTPVPAIGLTLDISDNWAGPSLDIPGFLSQLDANGEGTATSPIPNDPSLAGLRVSAQAIGGFGPYYASNLVRVTVQERGTFAPSIGAPTVPIQGGGIVVEDGGSFLFAGGSGPVAQRYSSRTEEWDLAGATFGVGLFGQATGLPDGRVLFTGGIDPLTQLATNAAALYDPATQQTTTLTMLQPRAGHGASVIGNGLVLITGGLQSFNLADPLSIFSGLTNTSEFFDPATGTFSAGPNMLEARALHTQSTLSTGDALVAGGLSVIPFINLPTVSATAYRYSPGASTFGLPATMSGGRFLHSAAALDDGKVLLVGGITLDLTTFLTTLNVLDIGIVTRDDCQLFNRGFFGFGSFTTVSGMQEGRAGAGIAALPGGRALIAGGFQLTLDLATQTFGAALLDSADTFAQGPNTIAPTGKLASPRFLPQTANLPDGTVLIVGGGATQPEIYQN